MQVNRQEIMSRAWELFRSTYRYPSIPFASIGRHCFNGCLRHAWGEAKERARIAAIPAAVKVARIAALQAHLVIADYADCTAQVARSHHVIAAEIAALSA